MAVWFVMLVGSVLFGAAIVGALILPRAASPLSLLGGLAALYAAVAAVGHIVQLYGTPEALSGALVILIAGITAGYSVAASALPHLARRPRTPVPSTVPTSGDATGVVLFCYAEPARYSPAAVATRQDLYAESAGVVVPVTALPFVFFAERARYRTIGGVAPAASAACRLSAVVERLLPAPVGRIDLAWGNTPGALAHAVAAQRAAGVEETVVVALGPEQSAQLDQAHHVLDDMLRNDPGIRVTFGPSVWQDRELPSHLVTRILSATAGAEPAGVGVVLVGEGLPEPWARRYAIAAATENYFNQRVRVLLGELGISDRHVRLAWLDWQTPDVTEAVRHLAALGCTRIVVTPSTIALPTLETTLDLGHSISLARVPSNVKVVSLPTWADDQSLAEAIARSATEATDTLSHD